MYRPALDYLADQRFSVTVASDPDHDPCHFSGLSEPGPLTTVSSHRVLSPCPLTVSSHRVLSAARIYQTTLIHLHFNSWSVFLN